LALTSLLGITVRLKNVSLGGLTQTNNAAHSARCWTRTLHTGYVILWVIWNTCYGCYEPWTGYTVANFTAYQQPKSWTNQSGSGACWRLKASSDVAALYHLMKGSSRIGFE